MLSFHHTSEWVKKNHVASFHWNIHYNNTYCKAFLQISAIKCFSPKPNHGVSNSHSIAELFRVTVGDCLNYCIINAAKKGVSSVCISACSSRHSQNLRLILYSNTFTWRTDVLPWRITRAMQLANSTGTMDTLMVSRLLVMVVHPECFDGFTVLDVTLQMNTDGRFELAH